MYADMHDVTIHTLSQAQAARAAGVSRTSIHRALRSGRISGVQGPDGGVRIDPSELLRVYPDANLKQDVPRTRDVTRNDAYGGERVALRSLIDELKGDKLRLTAELDRAHEEHARLLTLLERSSDQVRLLTDERQATTEGDVSESNVVVPEPEIVEEMKTHYRSWWRWVLFVVV